MTVAMRRRLAALEAETGAGDGLVPRVIKLVSITSLDEPGWLAVAKVIPPMGRGVRSDLIRGDDEPLRVFLERVAVIYEQVHGPVPEGWYDDDGTV